MKALSIRQPWAHLIIHGGKDIENRKWSTKYRGPILIHAAASMTKAELMTAWSFVQHRVGGGIYNDIHLPNASRAPRGGIIGSAILADVVTQSDSPWFTGPYGFVLTDVNPPLPPPAGQAWIVRGAGMIDISAYECQGDAWIMHHVAHDPACGCTEEQWLTPKGCLTLHVAPCQTVLECWIGYSFDEEDTQAIVRTPKTSRRTAYDALLGEIQEDWP